MWPSSSGRPTPPERGVLVAKLIYSMGGVSADGFIAGPDGDFSWGAPDEELFRFHTERVRALGGHLLGRRLYEAMLYWETAHEDPEATESRLEFAAIWNALPKVVFSRTLDDVVGTARLARAGIAEEVAELQERTGKDVEIGGAGLAAEALRLGLIEDFRLFVYPVVTGGGTPFFPTLAQGFSLQLVETRTFESRVVYLRYARA
jgi:dihydrofolate reductase